jgi:hypothetical protein
MCNGARATRHRSLSLSLFFSVDGLGDGRTSLSVRLSFLSPIGSAFAAICGTALCCCGAASPSAGIWLPATPNPPKSVITLAGNKSNASLRVAQGMFCNRWRSCDKPPFEFNAAASNSGSQRVHLGLPGFGCALPPALLNTQSTPSARPRHTRGIVQQAAETNECEC